MGKKKFWRILFGILYMYILKCQYSITLNLEIKWLIFFRPVCCIIEWVNNLLVQWIHVHKDRNMGIVTFSYPRQTCLTFLSFLIDIISKTSHESWLRKGHRWGVPPMEDFGEWRRCACARWFLISKLKTTRARTY